MADRLADMGYLTLLPDLYYRSGDRAPFDMAGRLPVPAPPGLFHIGHHPDASATGRSTGTVPNATPIQNAAETADIRSR